MCALPQGSKDSQFRAFGPKDYILWGFWSMLSPPCDAGHGAAIVLATRSASSGISGEGAVVSGDGLKMGSQSQSPDCNRCILRYIYITIHDHKLPYIATHYTTCYAFHCIALHSVASHCIALHCVTLHCTTLHSMTFHDIPFYYIT